MNIFATNIQPIRSALDHCDRHLVKMIVEAGQLICTAHWILDNIQKPYKPTHFNHPSACWLRETRANYQWGYAFLDALCTEYTRRYGKVHATAAILPSLKDHPKNIPEGDLTPFALAMPEHLKSSDPVESYRNYIIEKFQEWLTRQRKCSINWTSRELPEWLVPYSKTKVVYRDDGRVTIQIIKLNKV